MSSFLKNYFHQQRALFHRNYRLFLVGQGMSLIGTWIQRMAMIWLAYQLSGSAFLLGLVGFCEQIPIFLLAPVAGVYADRWDKLKALKWIELFAMLQAILLGALTLLGMVTIWHLILLSLTLGVINAFEVPLRQSFVVDMVDRDKNALGNAIALNSTAFNLTRLIGPSIAGVLISAVGEGWCFMVNGLSYGIVLISLLSMRLRLPADLVKGKPEVWRKLKEGFEYISTHKIMKSLLLMLAVISFSNASLKTLAPIFAQNVLDGDANTLGWLMTAGGLGAIIGALFLTRNKTTGLLNTIITFTGLLLGIGMLGFGASGVLVFSLFFVALAGLGQMMHTASTNTLLQLYTHDDKRGRVMSFYTVCLQGTMPFGSLVAGFIAQHLNAQVSMLFMGALCIVATLIFKGRQGIAQLHRRIH